MQFASDNGAGVAPELMAALASANDGAAAAYGDDAWTERVSARLAEVFERRVDVFLVSTGTAANAITLSAMTPPWGAVLCAAAAHIDVDECGAPEFYTGGAKLRPLASVDGRIALDGVGGLRAALAEAAASSVHQVQPKALSLTQATEAGAVYQPQEIADRAEAARGGGLKVHMDGTRFANAVARLAVSPADLSWRAGVDALCLGATKNGAMAAEAILCFDQSLAEEIAFRRKRGGHLLSKMRFVAAQLDAWLEGDLWLRLAARANAMADRLAEGLRDVAGAAPLHPVEANMVFARLPSAACAPLEAAGARFYRWPDHQPEGPTVSVRLVCSNATTEEEIDRFLDIARRAGPAVDPAAA